MVAKTFDPKALIKGNILVKDIDDNDLWFESDDLDAIRLPGQGGAQIAANTVARKQVRTLVRGLMRRTTEMNDYANKSFADALTAERRRIRMSPNQWDITLVNSYFADSRAENAPLALTDDQKTIVVNYLSALAGTKDFWWAPTQARIAALDEDLKRIFKMRFLNIQTRGDLDDTLMKFSAFVGDVPAERAREARTLLANATNEAAVNDLVNSAMAEGDEDEIDPFK